MPPFDFIIVGGGPAGSTAAALLAQRGLRIALCEQKTFPRPKVCGEFISPRIRPLLRQLSLESDFDRLAGPPIRRLLACPFRSLTLPGRFPAPYPRALARDQFDDLLLTRARQLGITLFQPCLATSITGSLAEGFQVATNSHGLLHSRAVILAHGLAQRGAMNPAPASPNPHPASDFISFKAHFSHCSLPDDTIAIAAAPALYAGLVRTSDRPSASLEAPAAMPSGAGAPLGMLANTPTKPDGVIPHSAAPRYSLAFVIRRRRLDLLGHSAQSHFQDLLHHNPAFAALLGNDSQRLSPWLASGPLRPGIRQTYHDGRFFLGNAAGEVHALVGEGLTLALRSADLLNAALAAHPADLQAAGRAYSRHWHRAFTPRCHAANLFARIMMRPALAAPLARFIHALPPLMNCCLRAAGKTP